jgi:hypothetical protein
VPRSRALVGCAGVACPGQPGRQRHHKTPLNPMALHDSRSVPSGEHVEGLPLCPSFWPRSGLGGLKRLPKALNKLSHTPSRPTSGTSLDTSLRAARMASRTAVPGCEGRLTQGQNTPAAVRGQAPCATGRGFKGPWRAPLCRGDRGT